jgi:hypothetical protein
LLQLIFPTSSSGFVEQSVASLHVFQRELVASSSDKQDKKGDVWDLLSPLEGSSPGKPPSRLSAIRLICPSSSSLWRWNPSKTEGRAQRRVAMVERGEQRSSRLDLAPEKRVGLFALILSKIY